MKKKVLCAVLGLTLTLGMGITSMAAPVGVEGGGVFDAEYYAENNADVVNELGTDFLALWQHFTWFGANEGRLPFAIGTDWEYIQENGPFQSLTNSQTVTTTTDTTTTATTEEVATEETTTATPTVVSTAPTDYSQAGVSYPLSTVEYEVYYDKELDKDVSDYAQYDASYIYVDGVNKMASDISGYNWKVGTIQFSGMRGDYYEIPNIDGATNLVEIDTSNIVQYFPQFNEYGVRHITDDNQNEYTYNIYKAYLYNVTGADGTVKTGYVVYLEEHFSPSDYINYSSSWTYNYYYMVPTDYTGNVSLTISGSKLVKNEIIENTADSHTFLVK